MVNIQSAEYQHRGGGGDLALFEYGHAHYSPLGPCMPHACIGKIQGSHPPLPPLDAII